MAGFDRSRIRLGNRTQQQTDTADDKSGSQRKSFMNYRKCHLDFFKFGEVGKYQDINILPWKITTKNHPEVVRTADEPETLRNGQPNPDKVMVGDYDYVLDVWIHSHIGPNEEDCVCLKKTYGKPCPICDEADRLWASEDKDVKESARPLFARRRCIYLVDELNDKFESKSDKPKIFEVAHGNFTKDLQSKATSCLRGKGVVNFADPSVQEGRVVSFTVAEDTMGKNKTYKKASGFEFNKRVEEISDEMLENCPSLDAMLIVKTPEQMKAILFGDPDIDDAEGQEYHQDEADSTEQDYRSESAAPSRSYRQQDETPSRSYRPQAETPARSYRQQDEAPERSYRQQTSARFVDNAPEQDERPRTETRRTTERSYDTVESRTPATEERRPVARAERAETRMAATDDAADGYQRARIASRRETSAASTEDTNTMPFDEPVPETDRAPMNSKDTEDIHCPYGHVFGEDPGRGEFCGKCPDHLYSKCLARHNGEI